MQQQSNQTTFEFKEIRDILEGQLQQRFCLKYLEKDERKIEIEFYYNEQKLTCLRSMNKDESTIIKLFQLIKEQNSPYTIKVQQNQEKIRGYLFLGMLFFKQDEDMILIKENLTQYQNKLHEKYHSKEIKDIINDLYDVINQKYEQPDELTTVDNSSRYIERFETRIDQQELLRKISKLHEIQSEIRLINKFQEFKQSIFNYSYSIYPGEEKILMQNGNPYFGFQIKQYGEFWLLCKGQFQQSEQFYRGEIVKFFKKSKKIIYYQQIIFNADEKIEGQLAKVYYYNIGNNINMVEYQYYKMYSGKLKDDKPNGKGEKKYFQNGQVEKFYRGKWKNGKLEGDGFFDYQGEYPINIKIYQYNGQFSNSAFHGKGKAYVNQTKTKSIQGEFNQGKMISQTCSLKDRFKNCSKCWKCISNLISKCKLR